MKILNFTENTLTKEQLDSLVREGFSLENIEIEAPEWLKDHLKFMGCPSREELEFRARALADYAEIQHQATDVIIGGAHYLTWALDTALIQRGIKPRYVFAECKAVETVNPNGTTTMMTVFRNSGWVV